MSRPKVLVITSTFPATEGDGRPAFVKDLAEIEAETFDVTVLAPRIRGAQADWPKIQVIRFPYFPKRYEGLADDAILPTLRSEPRRWTEVPFLVGAMAFRTVKVARAIRPNAVHAHWILPGGLAAFVNHLINRTPYVVTVHGADIYAMRGWVASRIKRMVLSRAAAIVPVSADAALVLRSLDPRFEITTTEPIPMGVRSPGFVSRRRSGGTFLFVGRLAEKKGLDIAIRAVAATPGARLRVVGTGPNESMARRAVAEFGIEARVSFLGRCDRAEVFREMASASALVIPSIRAADGDQDGTPVVLGEAMSLATPVIAAKVGGLEDHVVDGLTGFLFDPGDVDQLGSVMGLCLADPALAERVGEAGRAYFVNSPLNLEWTGQRYALLLENAMADL